MESVKVKEADYTNATMERENVTAEERDGSMAIVLLSGGIDSATCLALATDHYDTVLPVHYDYGQQTSEFEHQQAHQLARHYRRVGHDILPLKRVVYEDVFQHFAGGVASERDSFVTDDGDLEEEDGRSTGYVPMRNLHLITTGAAIADVEGADAVYHGAQMGDEEAYPDCRPSFIEAAEDAVNRSLADGEHIDVRTPLMYREKVEVLQLGDDRDVPWQYTYSCYEAIEDTQNPEPCGECPACIERAEAFQVAGITDPFGTPEAVQENSPEAWEEILAKVNVR